MNDKDFLGGGILIGIVFCAVIFYLIFLLPQGIQKDICEQENNVYKCERVYIPVLPEDLEHP